MYESFKLFVLSKKGRTNFCYTIPKKALFVAPCEPLFLSLSSHALLLSKIMSRALLVNILLAVLSILAISSCKPCNASRFPVRGLTTKQEVVKNSQCTECVSKLWIYCMKGKSIWQVFVGLVTVILWGSLGSWRVVSQAGCVFVCVRFWYVVSAASAFKSLAGYFIRSGKAAKCVATSSECQGFGRPITKNEGWVWSRGGQKETAYILGWLV